MLNPRAYFEGTALGSADFVMKPPGRWQYPLVGLAVAANALLAFQGQAQLTLGKLMVGSIWLVAAAALGYGFWRREQKLSVLCELDAPTGLYNRRHFELCFKRSLALAARHREPLALFVIDVDGLKAINDRLGHRAGDAAISLVADALRKSCRTEDVAARWGGDEFVVLAPHTTAPQAESLARRLSSAVREQAANNSAEAGLNRQPSAPWVTVSVGYAIGHPAQGSALSASTLFAEADQAMYRRKASRTAPTSRLGLVRAEAALGAAAELEGSNP